MMKEQQARKLKEQCKYDQQERKHMKVDDTKSKDLKFGTKQTTWKDIGDDDGRQETAPMDHCRSSLIKS